MAELMVDYITSLDGFGAAEGWPGLWGMGDTEYFAWLEEDAQNEYRLIMGPATYRLFAEMVESGAEGMDDLTTRQKLVFSRSLDGPLAWDNSTLVDQDAVEAVRVLKEDDGPLCAPSAVQACAAR